MILVNGAQGMGTGWSTNILQYNPIQIAELLLHKLKHDSWDNQLFLPYY